MMTKRTYDLTVTHSRRFNYYNDLNNENMVTDRDPSICNMTTNSLRANLIGKKGLIYFE